MRRAIALARRATGLTAPNPVVGAVIVNPAGEIIGEGYHHRAGEAHAEVEALRSLASPRLAVGSTLYVTLEPCTTWGRTPPCAEAILNSGIGRVVIGCLDPNPKHAGRAVEILGGNGVEVEVGIEEKRCTEINRDFFRWITCGTPWTVLKLAATLDGKIACANGCSKWITGEEARRRVQALRRRCGCILTSSRTVLTDRPRLDVRIPAHWERQPVVAVACRETDPCRVTPLFPGREVLTPRLTDAPSWRRFLEELGKREVMSLLIEAGGELAASALRSGVVDEIEFHYAPKILGGRGSRPMAGGADMPDLDSAIALKEVKIRRYGTDFAVNALVVK